MKFKVGDKVKCSNKVGNNPFLKHNEIYEVDDVDDSSDIRLVGDKLYYLPYRFSLVNDFEKPKQETKQTGWGF